MTLTPIDSVTPKSELAVTVAWTSPAASDLSWIFVNGRIAAGPLAFATAARSAVVGFPATETAAIEVHDLPAGSSADVRATWSTPNTRPRLRWARVNDAARYRLYHREAADVDESLVYDAIANASQERMDVISPNRLDGQGGVWHFFRVESVDARGNESARLSWPYRVMEPPAPVALTVAAGSAPNLFNVTVGA